MKGKSNRFKLMILGLGFLGAYLLAAAPFAHATSIQYDLTSDHCTGGCGPAGTIFGTVTLDDNGGPNVTIDVHLFSPYAFANTGAADNQAFKFNAVGIVLGDITIAAHVPGLQANGPGAFDGDGTGHFAWGISCPSCGGGLSSAFTNDIVFTVANATIADLTTGAVSQNGLGNFFVADIGNTQTGLTGPVDASNPGHPPAGKIPEPSTLLLFGSGLVALSVFVRSRLARR